MALALRERREQAEAQVAEVVAVKVTLPAQAALALQELRLLAVQVAVAHKPQLLAVLALLMVAQAALELMLDKMVAVVVAVVNPAVLGRSKALIHQLLEIQVLQAQ
jgi:hypothetical protein